MPRSAAKIAFALLTSMALAGCGVKGSLEAPEGEKPAPTASAQSGQGKAEGEGGKPHKEFVLDRLLR